MRLEQYIKEAEGKEELKKWGQTFGKHHGVMPDEHGFFDMCVKHMKDKIDDAEAYCARVKDAYNNSTYWRGKDKPKDEVEADVKKHPLKEASSIQPITQLSNFVGKKFTFSNKFNVKGNYGLNGKVNVKRNEKLEDILKEMEDSLKSNGFKLAGKGKYQHSNYWKYKNEKDNRWEITLRTPLVKKTFSNMIEVVAEYNTNKDDLFDYDAEDVNEMTKKYIFSCKACEYVKKCKFKVMTDTIPEDCPMKRG